MTYIKRIVISLVIASILSLIPIYVSAQFSLSGLKNLPANPPELDQEAVPWLPFEEDWSSGHFETNLWEVENNGNANWRIEGQAGNEAPSVEFSYNPMVTNYQIALTSRLLFARNFIDGGIYLSFDLKNSLVNNTGHEFLRIQVLTDSTWLTVSSDSDLVTINEWSQRKLNITEYVKGKTFKFRFLAEGQNSLDIYNWMIDNISVYRECAPPLNLWVGINFPFIDEVILEWDPPTGPIGNSVWVGWDNGSNNDAIGLTDGGTFSAAIRFTQAQLNEYDGDSLTKIRMFPYNSGGTIVLKVWTGADAAQLELEQIVETYTPGIWNEFILDNPVAIPLDDEIWFGYTVTHTAGNNIAGIDSGPTVAGFGDMINMDGSTWESMATAYGFNFNWNLQGFLQTTDGVVKILSSQQSANEDFIQNIDAPINDNSNTGDRSLIRYDIYDCYNYPAIYVGSTTETTYIYQPENYPDGFCFYVSAVYTDCEAFSNECNLFIPKPVEPLHPFEIYPVPADQTLTIDINTPLSSLIITDLYNQPVYQIGSLNVGSFIINTSAFRNGIYLIRSIETDGNISTYIFIINH